MSCGHPFATRPGKSRRTSLRLGLPPRHKRHSRTWHFGSLGPFACMPKVSVSPAAALAGRGIFRIAARICFSPPSSSFKFLVAVACFGGSLKRAKKDAACSSNTEALAKPFGFRGAFGEVAGNSFSAVFFKRGSSRRDPHQLDFLGCLLRLPAKG